MSWAGKIKDATSKKYAYSSTIAERRALATDQYTVP